MPAVGGTPLSVRPSCVLRFWAFPSGVSSSRLPNSAQLATASPQLRPRGAHCRLFLDPRGHQSLPGVTGKRRLHTGSEPREPWSRSRRTHRGSQPLGIV